ncbi:amino-acid N-acetyltransferase, partial [bacterium]|nr:amino-acid N-acetyltransferase [bacterium]
IHPDYQNEGRGNELFNWVEKKARNAGLEQVFLLTTQAEHWFLEHGFNQASLDDLPVSRKLLYNYQRNSKVLIKRFT